MSVELVRAYCHRCGYEMELQSGQRRNMWHHVDAQGKCPVTNIPEGPGVVNHDSIIAEAKKQHLLGLELEKIERQLGRRGRGYNKIAPPAITPAPIPHGGRIPQSPSYPAGGPNSSPVSQKP